MLWKYQPWLVCDKIEFNQLNWLALEDCQGVCLIKQSINNQPQVWKDINLVLEYAEILRWDPRPANKALIKLAF